MKAFITNNHMLDEEFLNNEKKLVVFIEEVKIEINLEKERFIFTDKEMDFTIIEILEDDNINHFLEIDEYINTEDYKEEQIFSFQYPDGNNLKYSHGKILAKKDIFFI